MGGSLARREATGRGCMIATVAALTHLGLPVKGRTVVVQGFGNVGSIAFGPAARGGLQGHCHQRPQGGWSNRKGIDVKHASRMWPSTRRSRASAAAEPSRTRGCLELECDVLFRRRSKTVITTRTRPRKAKIGVRGGHGPTSAGADCEFPRREGGVS